MKKNLLNILKVVVTVGLIGYILSEVNLAELGGKPTSQPRVDALSDKPGDGGAAAAAQRPAGGARQPSGGDGGPRPGVHAGRIAGWGNEGVAPYAEGLSMRKTG